MPCLHRVSFASPFPVVSSEAVNSLICGKTFPRAKKAALYIRTSVQPEPTWHWWLLAVIANGSEHFPICLSFQDLPIASALEQVLQGPGNCPAPSKPFHICPLSLQYMQGDQKFFLGSNMEEACSGRALVGKSVAAEDEAVQLLHLSRPYTNSSAMRVINGCQLLANEAQFNCSDLQQPIHWIRATSINHRLSLS